MKKITQWTAVAVCALMLAGCSASSRTDRAIVGGAVGAGAGAAIGAAATRSVGGAVVGGIIGGAAGAIVGAETTPRNCVARDYRGRRVYVQCP